METYHVIITHDAEKDLNELDDYISFSLKSPDIAIAFLDMIKTKILLLCSNPKRHRLIDDEPWHSRGVRRMNIRSFAVLYTIREEYNEVYILNLIYQKRDLNNILMNLRMVND